MEGRLIILSIGYFGTFLPPHTIFLFPFFFAIITADFPLSRIDTRSDTLARERIREKVEGAMDPKQFAIGERDDKDAMVNIRQERGR
jgi:hypothetical protein